MTCAYGNPHGRHARYQAALVSAGKDANQLVRHTTVRELRVETDSVAGALARGGRGLASPSIRTISSGMLDVKGDVCKTDELDGRVDGVRAREQQRSSARMHA